MSLPDRAAEMLAADVLQLILLPTEACNFRCTYCYEDFRMGRMTGGVISGVENLLSRRAGSLRRLDISWFGGEPLLASDIVLRIMRHADGLARRHPDLQLASDMTTNGCRLDPDLFRRLHEVGVRRYQVSFDGLDDEHDRKRVRAGGGGTFAGIWSNLLAIRRLPLPCTIVIRLHVDRGNAAACPMFVERLKRDFGGDPRFPLFPKLLGRWGGPNDERLSVYEAEPGRQVLDGIEERARAIGVPLYRVGGEKSICYAARGNSFLVRADGRINKCTLALEAPANQVGRLCADGRLDIDPDRMVPWMRGLWTGSVGELQCPMRGLAEKGPLPGAGAAALSRKSA